jgi:uncharacterized protein YtpQ (UPF0354 family)
MKNMLQKSFEIKRKLDQAFGETPFQTQFDRETDQYRVVDQETNQGVTIHLTKVIEKYEKVGDEALLPLVDKVTQSLNKLKTNYHLEGNEKRIFPVMRAESFTTIHGSDKQLISTPHTAETTIFYALDLEMSYQLIDEAMLQESGWTKAQLHDYAMMNLKALPIDLNKQTVAGNDFYFVKNQDGYTASRILHDEFLANQKARATGELSFCIPHQDAFIVADIHNPKGYDILQQMAMQFFSEGQVPITALSFLYEDDALTPIFIMAKKKPTD